MGKENFCPDENFSSAAHRSLTVADCCAGIHWSPPPGLASMWVSVGLSETVLGVCPFGQTGYSCTRIAQSHDSHPSLSTEELKLRCVGI